MPHTAGQLISRLLARVRDPHGIAIPREVVRRALIEAQRAVNLQREDALETLAFTLEPHRIFYPTHATFPRSARLKVVTFDGVDLAWTPWENLQLAPGWFRAVGPKPFVWSMVSRDLFLVWPAIDREVLATGTYVRLTDPNPDTLADSDPIEIADDAVEDLLDLVEATLHIRNRNFASASRRAPLGQERRT